MFVFYYLARMVNKDYHNTLNAERSINMANPPGRPSVRHTSNPTNVG